MLRLNTTSQFERDVRRMLRSGHDPDRLRSVVEMLLSEVRIPEEFRDHELSGRWAGVRDIHIMADWLQLYRIVGHDLVPDRTGTHDDLFSRS